VIGEYASLGSAVDLVGGIIVQVVAHLVADGAMVNAGVPERLGEVPGYFA
jgi:hypothetical protein